jgi:hypothetical protein
MWFWLIKNESKFSALYIITFAHNQSLLKQRGKRRTKMKLIFTFIVVVVIISLIEVQGAPSLVDPDTDDTEWGGIEDDYDYIYCK